MIKKYKQFNESLLNKIIGPTEEEVWDSVKNEENELHLLIKSIKVGLLNRVKNIIENTDIVKNMSENDLNWCCYNAINNSQLEIVKYFVENKLISDINSGTGSFLRTACRHGYNDIAEYLLQNGANTFKDAYNTAHNYGNLDLIPMIYEYKEKYKNIL